MSDPAVHTIEKESAATTNQMSNDGDDSSETDRSKELCGKVGHDEPSVRHADIESLSSTKQDGEIQTKNENTQNHEQEVNERQDMEHSGQEHELLQVESLQAGHEPLNVEQQHLLEGTHESQTGQVGHELLQPQNVEPLQVVQKPLQVEPKQVENKPASMEPRLVESLTAEHELLPNPRSESDAGKPEPDVRKREFHEGKPEPDVRKPEPNVRKREFHEGKPEPDVRKRAFHDGKPEPDVRKREFQDGKLEPAVRNPELDFTKCILLTGVVLVIFAIICALVFPPIGTPISESRLPLQLFQEQFRTLKNTFPEQTRHLWLRSEKMLQNHLNKSHPREPATIILTAAQDAKHTLLCLGVGLARAYAVALDTKWLVIDGPSQAKYDSGTAKLNIDQQLSSGFESAAGAAVLSRLETLPSGSLLILYKYCDHENAAYKNVTLVLTVLLDEATLEEDTPLPELEEKVRDFLYRQFITSEGIRAHNEMDRDKLGGVWSRISHLVLPVLPVASIEAGNCPKQ